MTPAEIIGIIIIAVIVAAAALWFLYRRQRSKELRSRFGPEYVRTLNRAGSQTRAEEDLEKRQERMKKYHIRSLPPSERDQFAARWHDVQSRFVDDPAMSINDADRLVTDLMRARGYPMSDFERQAQDLSVDHPYVVENYRSAHEIAARYDKGQASTEDLRKAVVYYRELFDDLLEAHPAGPKTSR